MHILGLYFGWPTGAVWSNLLASGICSLLVYLRMHAKLKASHQALADQAQQQHTERMAQAVAHHGALLLQANRHHEQALDRMDAHAMAAKSQARGGSTPFDSRERLDGPPAAAPKHKATP